uniref:Peptidase metallopeptidase domain-containing protein n=1 Tax=Kalanchoe fedtschenkoi TaxID=63787 RepID=A0A7N0VA65_KALFE
MALKAVHPLLLLLLACFLVSQATADGHHAAFDYIQGLKGCHKGQKNVTHLHNLKAYLAGFGYPCSKKHLHDDEFDASLEGVLAHAFAPTNGRMHFDATENWTIHPLQNAMHIETVAVHEIGHLLGLGHSTVQDAIMYPTIPYGVNKLLHADDREGVRVLYL